MNSASEDIQPVLPPYDDTASADGVPPNIKHEKPAPSEPLPGYTSVAPILPEAVWQAAMLDIAGQTSPEHSEHYVPLSSRQLPDAETLYKQMLDEVDKGIYRRRRPYSSLEDPYYHCVIKAFFDAIRNDSAELVTNFLSHGLLDANTPGVGQDHGTTPLIHAVQYKRRAAVEILMAHSARVNDFGILQARNTFVFDHSSRGHRNKGSARPQVRTPLQVACAQGDLAMVKLLREQYGADDTLVAPDGQIALRLASTGKHNEIVDYLPARRGGALKRIKAKNRRLIRRVTKSALDVFELFRGVFYDVPKCLVKCFYDMIRDSAMYCWKHRKEFIPGCIKCAKRLGKAIMSLPEALWEACTELSKLTFDFVTKRIPKAIKVVGKFLGESIKTVGKAIWWIVDRTASALHTAFVYVMNKIRGLTWSDVRRGFVDLLKAVFVSFPKALWKASESVIRGMKKGFIALFGCFGWIIWHLPELFVRLVMFIFKPVWRSLEAIVGTCGAAVREVRIVFNPKA